MTPAHRDPLAADPYVVAATKLVDIFHEDESEAGKKLFIPEYAAIIREVLSEWMPPDNVTRIAQLEAQLAALLSLRDTAEANQVRYESIVAHGDAHITKNNSQTTEYWRGHRDEAGYFRDQLDKVIDSAPPQPAGEREQVPDLDVHMECITEGVSIIRKFMDNKDVLREQLEIIERHASLALGRKENG